MTASSHATLSAGTLVLVTCFSTFLLISGLRHYRGHGVWLLRWLPTEVSFFGGAWFGAGGLMLVLCELAQHVSLILTALLAIPMFGFFAISIMALVWLPPRLLPAWYREQRSHRRSVARAAR